MPKYQLDLNKIQKGDIILFRSRWSFISFLIRGLTRGKVNHAAQVITWGDYPHIIHATASIKPSESKVKKEFLNNYIKKNIDLTVVRIRKDLFDNEIQYKTAIDKVIERAYCSIDVQYDWLGVMGFIPVIIGRKLHLKFKNYLEKRRRLFCSELIADCWYNTSTKVKGNIFAGKHFSDTASTSPQDILKSKHIEFVCGKYYSEFENA